MQLDSHVVRRKLAAAERDIWEKRYVVMRAQLECDIAVRTYSGLRDYYRVTVKESPYIKTGAPTRFGRTPRQTGEADDEVEMTIGEFEHFENEYGEEIAAPWGEYRFANMDTGVAVVEALKELGKTADINIIADCIKGGGNDRISLRAINAALRRIKNVEQDDAGRYYVAGYVHGEGITNG